VIVVQGGQGVDLWVFNAEDPQEFLSAGHTLVQMGQIYPQKGWTFVTNERRPILEFTDDTSPGRHDCLAAACDRSRYELLGGGPEHGSCEQNLQSEVRKHGFELAHAPQPINVFANFRVGPNGEYELLELISRPGDAATFKVLMDSVVVISACPQDMVPIFPGGPSDMAVEIVDGDE
jgi:uncharacterized protein YcgI (DUF1989 family)